MIEFKREFFEGEVRDGFFVASEMKCAWAAEMEIVVEIDRICEKYGITYFADSGTLLGAVRHNGFIPWDDDMDIAMKREDYNKFASVAAKELPKGWVYTSPTASGDWEQPFGRVLNGNAFNTSKEHLERFHGCPYLVGVDIFPLDYLLGNCEPNAEIDTIMSLLYDISYAKTVFVMYPERQQELKDLLSGIESDCRTKFDMQKNIPNQLARLMDRLYTLYAPEECGTVANISFLADASKYREYAGALKDKNWFRESIRLPFENITIPVPIDYHQVLTRTYGPNYMTPVKNWDTHNYPFYKKQKELLKKLKDDAKEVTSKLDELDAELERMKLQNEREGTQGENL